MRLGKPLVALTISAILLPLAACGAGEQSGTGNKALDAATRLLPLPEVDTSDGLVINGERIADAQLYDAAKQDSVILYSASGKESEDLTINRFMHETGIDVQLTRMATNKLAERVLSEHGVGRMTAEVIRVTDPRVADEFVESGVYVPYRTPFHDLLEKQENTVFADDRYVNAYFSVNSIGYNSSLVEPEEAPTSWMDLLDEKWHGKSGVVSVEAGGTLVALANFERTRLPAEFLPRFGATKPRVFDTTAVQINALARGEISVATLSFNNAFGAQASGAPITLVVPPEGVSGSMNPMGLTTQGMKSPAAQVFYNWTMSKEGQAFAAAQGFVPARTGLPPQRTGDYQLPTADSESFRLYGPQDFKESAAEDVRTWKTAFGFLG